MGLALRRILRELIVRLLFFLPQDKKIRAERWLRGREELRQLRLADCVIVSFGKSGRTWLRVMLSRFYQVKHDLASRHLLAFDNLHRKNSEIPTILLTHDNYLKDYTGNADSKTDYAGCKVVLLARHPADVAVSQFFQWKHRMRPAKKRLNAYPAEDEAMTCFDFVMDPRAGLPKIIDFMNLWAQDLPKLPQVLLVRYEDMRVRPEETLSRILDFIGTPGSAEQVKEAVEFARFDNMKQLEAKRVFWLSGSRMAPGDRNDPDSYKVRRAKVGGYRDDFSGDEAARIERMIEERLDSVFGYGAADRAAASGA